MGSKIEHPDWTATSPSLPAPEIGDRLALAIGHGVGLAKRLGDKGWSSVGLGCAPWAHVLNF